MATDRNEPGILNSILSPEINAYDLALTLLSLVVCSEKILGEHHFEPPDVIKPTYFYLLALLRSFAANLNLWHEGKMSNTRLAGKTMLTQGILLFYWPYIMQNTISQQLQLGQWTSIASVFSGTFLFALKQLSATYAISFECNIAIEALGFDPTKDKQNNVSTAVEETARVAAVNICGFGPLLLAYELTNELFPIDYFLMAVYPFLFCVDKLGVFKQITEKVMASACTQTLINNRVPQNEGDPQQRLLARV